MAHKDNVKNAGIAAKALLAPEPEVIVEPPLTLEQRTGSRTGCIQLWPPYPSKE
jgi:hypothetical protein